MPDLTVVVHELAHRLEHYRQYGVTEKAPVMFVTVVPWKGSEELPPHKGLVCMRAGEDAFPDWQRRMYTVLYAGYAASGAGWEADYALCSEIEPPNAEQLRNDYLQRLKADRPTLKAMTKDMLACQTDTWFTGESELVIIASDIFADSHTRSTAADELARYRTTRLRSAVPEECAFEWAERAPWFETVPQWKKRLTKSS